MLVLGVNLVAPEVGLRHLVANGFTQVVGQPPGIARQDVAIELRPVLGVQRRQRVAAFPQGAGDLESTVLVIPQVGRWPYPCPG